MEKKIRVGLIGVGGIMNFIHVAGYKKVKESEIIAVCDIDEAKLKAVGDELNIPEKYRFTDYRELIDCDAVDVVDIATWNSVHCEIAKYAAEAGKGFSVEKPVGMNYDQVRDLAETAEKKNVPTFVCLSWRYRPYTRYMKYLLDRQKVGKIYHIYVRCIKDSGLWEGRKREWRFDKARAASGVLGDLGSHMIDIVRFFGQEFAEVYARKGIFIKERPSEETGEILPVDTDDWCNIIAKLESDTTCTIELTRCATTVPDLIHFEIYGEKGKLSYTYYANFDNQKIEFVDAKTKKTEMLTPPKEFEAVQSQSFINLVNGIEDEYTAKIEHGLKCQAVIDAALISSEENRPVTIKEITK